jgi:flagellar biosynthesis protein FliQ
MDMAVVMDGAIAAAAGIITAGAEVVVTIMVGGIIAIAGDLTSISERPLSWRPLSYPSPISAAPRRSFTPPFTHR